MWYVFAGKYKTNAALMNVKTMKTLIKKKKKIRKTFPDSELTVTVNSPFTHLSKRDREKKKELDPLPTGGGVTK